MRRPHTRALLLLHVGLFAGWLAASWAHADDAAPPGLGVSSQRLGRISASMRELIDGGQLLGSVTVVHRRGELVHFEALGQRDREAGLPMTGDTIFRIYSMTKPIVSVAALMLYEEGRLLLTDPVSHHLPEFADLSVVRVPAGSVADVVPARRDFTVRDLLTHTSGLSATSSMTGADEPLSAAYRQAGLRDTHTKIKPDPYTRRLAELPLLFQPGTRFRYGISTDVLGVLIARVSGQPLERLLRERIFEPLGMQDTGFQVPPEKRARFAAGYRAGDGGHIELMDAPGSSRYLTPPSFPSGAGGLVSTAADYTRFARMLLGGGKLDEVRLLSPKTVELMTINHLSEQERDVPFMRQLFPGQGFGLGVAVLEQLAPGQVLGSVGQHGWGGAAGTYYWVDPTEELVAVLMVQIWPPSGEAISRFKTAVYQSIVD